ncbi:hypothetical protein NMY22_g13542 [Coprinellus aureogranulatus]|nr:hypothetical protein NMY22_g13542 [Coprinellus aureogranulatus]
MSQIITGRTVTLSAAPDSFPFAPKNIFVSSEGIILGSAGETGAQGEPSRSADIRNGWFGPLPDSKGKNPLDEDVYPISLSANHARLWTKDDRVYICCLGAAFKTYVNGAQISQDSGTELLSGDVVSLGSKIPRNKNTPSNIKDEHLKPIIAVHTSTPASSHPLDTPSPLRSPSTETLPHLYVFCIFTIKHAVN